MTDTYLCDYAYHDDYSYAETWLDDPWTFIHDPRHFTTNPKFLRNLDVLKEKYTPHFKYDYYVIKDQVLTAFQYENQLGSGKLQHLTISALENLFLDDPWKIWKEIDRLRTKRNANHAIDYDKLQLFNIHMP